jgi:predicted dehydrogenase
VQILAVCDANRESPGYWQGKVGGREPARRLVEEHYSKDRPAGTRRGCDATADYRELLGRADLDAVEICTPDHWHALMVVEACKARKDIYCQKPLSLTIAEGRAMSYAVSKSQVVFQTGSQQRSDRRFRTACELVRNGRIGRVPFSTVGRGTVDPSPVEGWMHGAVMWVVTGGTGWFAGARGLITSNFVASGQGEVVDNQFARLYLP